MEVKRCGEAVIGSALVHFHDSIADLILCGRCLEPDAGMKALTCKATGGHGGAQFPGPDGSSGAPYPIPSGRQYRPRQAQGTH